MKRPEAFSLTAHLSTGFGEFKASVRANAGNTAVNTEASPADAANKTDRLNTAGYLRHEFFNPANNQDNILVMSSLPSHARSAFVDPSAPYMPGSKMTVASNPELFTYESVGEQAPDHNELVPVDTIYALPRDAQTTYWTMIIQGLYGLQQLANDGPHPEQKLVFATENCMPRTSKEVRTGRSINLPHAQLHRADLSLITAYSASDMAKLPDYFKEEALLQGTSKLLADAVHERLDRRTKDRLVDVSDENAENAKLRQRNERPYGYTFTIKANISMEQFAGIMRDHHQAYEVAAKNILSGAIEPGQANVIPQPSYKLFLYLEKNGDISAIVNTAAFAPTGVLETAGVKLNRHVDNPNRVPQAELDKIKRNIGRFVGKQINEVQIDAKTIIADTLAK